jgi:CRISPR/Cas system CSM-associated protein Csm4 (group 5 of RAMP superfamily)
VEWGSGSYSLIERSGRSASRALAGQMKKTTRLVAEGSRLVARGALTGSIRDVAPEGAPHPFWRAGFAVALELPGGNVA